MGKPAFILPPPHRNYYYHFFIDILTNLLRRLYQDGLSKGEYTLYYSGEFAGLLPYFCDDIRPWSQAPDGTPTLPAKGGLFWRELLAIKRTLTAGLQCDSPERITLVERATNRRMKNHKELQGIIEGFGHEVVNVDTASVSFEEQVELFYNSKLVVAAHGSGLTNILFMQPGTTVVEINPYGFIWYEYQKMCKRLELNHHFFECLPESKLPIPEQLIEFAGGPPPYLHGDIRALPVGTKRKTLARIIRDQSEMKVGGPSFEKLLNQILSCSPDRPS